MDDEIGVKLLDRSNNRVALTEEGRLFLFESKKLLAMCAKSVAAVQRMKRGGTPSSTSAAWQTFTTVYRRQPWKRFGSITRPWLLTFLI
jgi:DNA-binding transcriptional LysR family regulator